MAKMPKRITRAGLNPDEPPVTADTQVNLDSAIAQFIEELAQSQAQTHETGKPPPASIRPKKGRKQKVTAKVRKKKPEPVVTAPPPPAGTGGPARMPSVVTPVAAPAAPVPPPVQAPAAPPIQLAPEPTDELGKAKARIAELESALGRTTSDDQRIAQTREMLVKMGVQGADKLADVKDMEPLLTSHWDSLLKGMEAKGKMEAKGRPQLQGQLALALGEHASPSLIKKILEAKTTNQVAGILGLAGAKGWLEPELVEDLLGRLGSEGGQEVLVGSADEMATKLQASRQQKAATERQAKLDLEAQDKLQTNLGSVGASPPGAPGTTPSTGMPEVPKESRLKKGLKFAGNTALATILFRLLGEVIGDDQQRPEALAKKQHAGELELLRSAGGARTTAEALEDLQNRKAELARMAMMGQVNPQVFKLLKTLQPNTLTRHERSYIPDPALAQLSSGGLQALLSNQGG